MNDLISYLILPETVSQLWFLKILFIIFSLISLGFIIFFLLKSSWLKYFVIYDLFEFLTYQSYKSKVITKQWKKIKKRLETDLEAEYKLALIEADSLLDEVFKKKGFEGDTLAEKLKKINIDILPNLEEIWQAHKIRNNIVHDPDYQLSFDEAKRTISIYEKALIDLEVI